MSKAKSRYSNNGLEDQGQIQTKSLQLPSIRQETMNNVSVISAYELQQIRSHISQSEGKAVSKPMDSQKVWAQRIQKQRQQKEEENYRKFIKEEEERRKLDHMEEEYQQKLKNDQVLDANTKIFNNRADVRTLKAKMLLGEVEQTNDSLIQINKEQREMHKMYDEQKEKELELQKYLQEQEEMVKEEKLLKLKQINNKVLAEQHKDARERLMKEYVKEMQEGQLIKQKAIEDEELREKQKIDQKKKKTNLLKDHQELLKVKERIQEEQKQGEEQEYKQIQDYELNKDKVLEMRKERELQKKQRQIQMRQQIYDIRAKQLKQQEQDYMIKIIKSQEEQRMKEDEIQKQKEYERLQLLEEAEQSRKLQLYYSQLKKEQEQHELNQEHEQKIKALGQLQILDEQQKEILKNRNKELHQYQKMQIVIFQINLLGKQEISQKIVIFKRIEGRIIDVLENRIRKGNIYFLGIIVCRRMERWGKECVANGQNLIKHLLIIIMIQDSIDDIINLLNNHYQPKKQRQQSSQRVERQQRKSYSLNQRTNSSKPDIRYLTFKSYSGNAVERVYDTGYYYKFAGNPIKLVKGLLEENGFKETQDKNWTIYWSTSAIKTEIYSNLFAYQKISHFPKSYELTRKDLMHRNISKMQINHGMINFNFIPKTYILPTEMSYFLEEHDKIRNQMPVYICKPHASSQGKGIFITDKIQEVQNQKQQILNKQNANNSYVVSHYIDKPLLINNLKFDLRIYVAITSINPLRIYIYQDGLARFATEQYNQEKGNRFVHLTNYSVNKDNPNFIANLDCTLDYIGSKWSLLSLKEYLRLNKLPEAQIFDRIDDLIIKTIISVESAIFQACEMNVPYRNNCFSLFGYDILIDSSFKPWLLEVNFSPSLNIDAPLDLKIKGDMLADLFTLIGVVPLDQRFTQKKSELEKQVLKESEDEEKRSRGWRRIFPSELSNRYTKYFEQDRALNQVLRQRQ